MIVQLQTEVSHIYKNYDDAKLIITGGYKLFLNNLMSKNEGSHCSQSDTKLQICDKMKNGSSPYKAGYKTFQILSYGPGVRNR